MRTLPLPAALTFSMKPSKPRELMVFSANDVMPRSTTSCAVAALDSTAPSASAAMMLVVRTVIGLPSDVVSAGSDPWPLRLLPSFHVSPRGLTPLSRRYYRRQGRAIRPQSEVSDPGV